MSDKMDCFESRVCKRKRSAPLSSNREMLMSLVNFAIPAKSLLVESSFHGNINWTAEQLVVQALIWSWQDSRNLTDAFEKTLEICEQLHIKQIPKTYTSFMNAISRYRKVLSERLRVRRQALIKHVGGKYYRTHGRVLIAVDGSRVSAPRSIANEKAFCAPNYGKGKEALYGPKKSKGLRRRLNKANPGAPPEPQVWVTMMWHMSTRLGWSWRLGPSNSSERAHLQEILDSEKFPRNTLFCADAGFVGYPVWKSILDSGAQFLIRVGANVSLLGSMSDIESKGGGIVLCWPKNQREFNQPLRLRLMRVKIGKTKMWLLTSICQVKELSKKQMVLYYKMRWGVEVEYRGLKQTIDKRKLRCKNSERLLAELEWSLQAMAIAQMLALKAQLAAVRQATNYEIKDRSLAKTMKALRRCMRNLGPAKATAGSILKELKEAKIQRYRNGTDKRARYRHKNLDYPPLADPKVVKPTIELRRKLMKIAA